MIEALFVVVAGGLLWAAHWALNTAPEIVFTSGVALVAVGFVFGLPTGILYHVFLYRSLRRIDALPGDWWLRPTTHHDRIPYADRPRVLGWCYAGALGFLVIMLGLPLAAAGAWRIG